MRATRLHLVWLVFWAVNLGIAATGALFVSPQPDWYVNAIHPAWSPPAAVFAPVWTFLYLTMAVAAGDLWERRADPNARTALSFYAVQLAANALWTPLFFGANAPRWALADLGVLVVALAMALVYARRASRFAFWLLLPAFIWGLYAVSLNLFYAI